MEFKYHISEDKTKIKQTCDTTKIYQKCEVRGRAKFYEINNVDNETIWIPAILNSQKGFCKVIDEVILEVPIPIDRNYHVPFNSKITQHIQNNRVIACCDASVKAKQIDGF